MMSCPAFTQCQSFLRIPGYSVQTSGGILAGNNCLTICAPQWLAWLWLLVFRWDCGPCEDFSSRVPPVSAAPLRNDVAFLASDKLMGRDNTDFLDGGSGTALAQEFLIQQLQAMGAVGTDTTSSGLDAYWQNATLFSYPIHNIIGILPGNDEELSSEYVVLGAHYDHISFCRFVSNADSDICNGATDNAASVAAVLSMGRTLKDLDPRRSIMLAFWDAEEDGLLGSLHFTDDDPLVPLDKIVSYINLDIMGANLVPSLRTWSFALGPETGGQRLQGALARAIEGEGLTMKSLSWILGQGRSDYYNFVNQNVPTIFFSDSNGGCYHTTGDEIKNVDFNKVSNFVGQGRHHNRRLTNTICVPFSLSITLVRS